MKEYLNDKKFLDFLLLMGVDIDKTEEGDLNEYYVAYKSTLDGLMKNINVIYDNLLNTTFKQEDVIESSEEKLDDILSIDLNNMDEIELKKLLDKTTNSPILSKYPDKGDLYKKLQVFFKKNNMKLYEIHIETNDKSQYVKETWVHKKSGYSMITAYPMSYETFNLLDSSMKKNIINKQQELNITTFDYEIDLLSTEDKIKYYEYHIKNAIKTENYEEAAKYRDIMKKITEVN